MRVHGIAGFVALGAWMGVANAATLIHSYDFTAGVVDLAGTANGTLVGDANVAGGRLNLDGNGDYVQFGSNIIPTSGSFSVALFGTRSVNQAKVTEMISQGSSGTGGFYIGTNASGNIRVGDQWGNPGVAFGAVGANTHYAIVVDSALAKSTLYVNGASVATLNAAITISGSTFTRLGRQFDPITEYFNGSIDNVQIYTGALTAQEVAALASPIPEVGTAALLATGLFAIAGLRLRRNTLS